MMRIFSIFRKLESFEKELKSDGRHRSLSIKKYIGDIKRFKCWCESEKIIFIKKEDVKNFIKYLKSAKCEMSNYENNIENISNTKNISSANKKLNGGYSDRTINGYISSLTLYFKFIRRYDLIVERLKLERDIFGCEEKEIEKSEIEKLIEVAFAHSKIRLAHIIEFIVNTGIRVSELRYLKVHNLENGYFYVECKNKKRKVIIPRTICESLLKYCRDNNIKNEVFVTRTGKSICRSNIWKEMKELCEMAGVDKKKVFPHNLRHFFARTFYNNTKDIDKLARVLGHSSIETTRIYTIESERRHREMIEMLDLPRGCRTKVEICSI